MIHHLQEWEEKCVVFAGIICPPALPCIRRYQRLLRYLVAGGTAAAVDLGMLYILTDVFFVHYLWSAVWAFVVSFFVSFLLQKFWTFQNRETGRMHVQMTLYFSIALANLAFNTFLMYLFVDRFHIWYLLAQILASGLIAFESFFISRHIVFKSKVNNESPNL
ncbi:MAG: GtrA family protein [Parcubacteria group bacterium GW2011_GWA2_49_9]|nr:MAG: GtrA family protein [Parcubacteria group bacterium GW2011_GWA2_49_9]